MSVAHLVSPQRAYHQAPTPELLSTERTLERLVEVEHGGGVCVSVCVCGARGLTGAVSVGA